MATLNRVFLIGNLTRDPEVRYLKSGQAVCELRLAISRRFKTTTGEERDEICYVNVVVWGRQGEACGQYLSKGSPLFVDGRLQFEEWEKDGQKSNRLRVVADRTQFIGAPRHAEYSDTAEAGAKGEAPVTARAHTAEDPGAMTGGAPVEGGGDEDNLAF
jgi:single-strand DNA-binding protein